MEFLNVFALLEATQAFERKLNLALMYAGLRLPQFRAMDFLEKSGKITVSDLSRQLNVTRATTSVLVNELMNMGVVENLVNRSDKRSFYIKLTDSGFKRLTMARREVSLVEEKISGEFSEEEVAALNVFSKMIRKG